MSKKPYVISFANQKGGVGKTTSIINMAAECAKRGYKVLIIDNDPQGNSTSGLGIKKKELSLTTYDIYIGGTDPDKYIQKTDYDNLFIVPATIDLAGAEFELITSQNRSDKMKNFITSLTEPFDFIFIDCPPSLGLLTVNALSASDGVVIPMQCEYYALEGLSQLMITMKKVKEVYNTSLRVIGILITMYNGRLNLSVSVLEEIKKYYSDKLFPVPIPRNVSLTEAPGFGEPINEYDKHSKGAKAYEAATDELLKRTIG